MSAKSGSDPSDTNFILLQQFATEYLEAAKLLAFHQPNVWLTRHAGPLATLLGHSLELSLKGLLSIGTMRAGSSIPRTHDLEELAADPSIASKISLSKEESDALQILNGNVARPFRARYPKLGLSSFPNHDSFRVLLGLADRLSGLLDAWAHEQNLNDPIVKQRLGAD